MYFRERDLNLKDYVLVGGKEYCVSTVALGINHGGYHGLPDLWYETMIFPSENGQITDWGDLYCERYTYKEEAIKGHEKIVEKLQKGLL